MVIRITSPQHARGISVPVLSKSKYRYFLLATVSAVALNISIERGVKAADVAVDDPVCATNWWFSAEGQYLLYEGKGPEMYGLSPDPEDGWGGGAAIGGSNCEGLSGVARVRFGRSKNKREETSYSSFATTGTDAAYQERHFIADLEIGRDVGLGSMDAGDGYVRVHGGLRYAYFDGNSDGSLYTSAFVDADHEFWGIGPRIGVDAALPVGGNAAVDLRAAGAVLFGRRKVEGFFYSTFTSGPVSRSDSVVVVPNVEASAALAFFLGENANIAVGYRLDHYWNVIDRNPFPGSSSKTNRTLHGPFLRVSVGGSN